MVTEADVLLNTYRQAERYLFVNTDSSGYFTQQGLNLSLMRKDSLYYHRFLFIEALNNTLKGKNELAYKQLKTVNKYAAQHGAVKLEISSNLNLGEIEYNWGNYNKAINIFVACANKSKQNKLREQEVMSVNFIGKYYHSVGNYDRSYKYYLKALKLAEEIGYYEQEISIHCKIGKHYETVGNNAKALEHYLQAKKALPYIKNRVDIATVYNHLGSLYDILGDYLKALDFHYNSLHEREKIKYIEGRAKSYKNIGEVYENMERYDSASYYYEASLKICEEINYQKGTIKSLHNLGDVYSKTNFTDKAITYYTKAFRFSENLGYDKGYIKAGLELCNIYTQTGNFSEALQLIEICEPIAEKINMLNELAEFKYNQYLINRKRGNYRQALDLHEAYADIISMVQNEEKNRYISKLQIEYETTQKEQQNQLLRKENELQALDLRRKSSTIIFGFIILGLVLLLTVLVYFRYRNKNRYSRHLESLNKRVTEQNNKLTQLNKELNEANCDKDKFFSIITHELRNPLWWFRNLADTLTKRFHQMDREKQEKALRSLDESAKTAFHLIENLLLWSRTQLNRLKINYTEVELEELIRENLRLYGSLIEFKQIEVKEALLCPGKIWGDKDLLNTIIRNILSNSVKFTPQQGIIQIDVMQDKKQTQLKIEDTGIGISTENIQKILQSKNYYSTLGLMQEKGSGLGMVLCKEFAEMMGGKLTIKSEVDKGTCIVITFPVEKKSVTEDKCSEIKKELV